MAIFSICMKRLPAKILTKFLCAFTLQCIILWVAFGLIMNCKPLFQDYIVWAKLTLAIMAPTVLGASALMQGLADGYFVIPYTIGNFLADEIRTPAIPTTHPAFEETEKAVAESLEKLMSIKGTETVESLHKRLGKIMWDKCGMAEMPRV